MLATAAALALLAWGVRTLPEGDAWRVRWEGGAPLTVDGRPEAARPGGLRLPADRPHTLETGGRAWRIPPRPTDRCGPLRFVVLGDGRAAADGVGPSAYWAGILAEALAVQPAFVINTGDLVKDPRSRHEWDRFLRSLPPWPPMLVVRGNHDRGPLFDELGLAPGPVSAWEAGPVRVVGLDTEAPALEALLPALEAALATGQAPWKVVVLHRPVWSRGNHGSDERGFNRLLVPLLDRHGVDLVLAGHDHHYERLCASLGVGPERRCDEAGPLYLVTGGAATFTNPVPGVSRKVDPAIAAADRLASRYFSGAKHFVRIDVAGGRLSGAMHRTRAGNLRPPAVIDRFERSKPVAGCPQGP